MTVGSVRTRADHTSGRLRRPVGSASTGARPDLLRRRPDTITALALRRGLPARAATIALATAIQESKLRNIRYGDRDSVGLFQQRPSQGWGTVEQILDPEYSTDKFYDALVKVDDWESGTITVVAQKVQRSSYPEAYADHEQEGRILASALAGHSPAVSGAASTTRGARPTSRCSDACSTPSTDSRRPPATGR